MKFGLRITVASLILGSILSLPRTVSSQDERPKQDSKKDVLRKFDDDNGPRGPGGFGGPMMGQIRKVVKQFDKDGDGRLNHEERQAARESLKKDGGGRGPFGKGPGGPGGFMGKGREDPPKPGPNVAPADVKNYPKEKLYEPSILRTVFLQFEDKDWEAELADFYHTDVQVPATMTVDGKTYPNVGVHFRGMSSYMGVGAGYKRSLNVSLDFANKKQRLNGYKTLNLLNSHDDPSYLNAILYSHIARQHISAPKVNLVKVVINGESWGVYANAQQFDAEFLKENFKTTHGTRWKVRGSPGGRGGLEYTGDNIEDYKRRFEIKSNDNETAWKSLIKLCQVLNQTAPDKLEEALKPILDVDALLWFLAVDVALINCDGYWIRASDYCLFLDDKGKFHVVPHDMNECFRSPMGPGMGGPGGMIVRGPDGAFSFSIPRSGEILPNSLQDILKLTDEQKKQIQDLQKDIDAKLESILTNEQRVQLKGMRDGGMAGGFRGPGGGPPGGGPGIGNVRGVELDPLVGLDDQRKPLRSKILAVPKFREQYLRNVRELAEKSLDWKNLGPLVAQYRTLIESEVEADTRKLDSIGEFRMMTGESPEAEGRGPGRRLISLKSFCEQRSKYLLNHPEIKKITIAMEK